MLTPFYKGNTPVRSDVAREAAMTYCAEERIVDRYVLQTVSCALAARGTYSLDESQRRHESNKDGLHFLLISTDPNFFIIIIILF